MFKFIHSIFIHGILDKINVKNRKMVINIFFGVIALLLIVIFWVSLRSCSTGEKENIPVTVNTRQNIIKHDELFLPEEPDFLPGIILERQQKDIWTEDDVMPWWKDPLESGEKAWRDLIEKTAEEILENIP